MRRFSDLSKKEKKNALIQAESELLKMMMLGKVEVPDYKICSGGGSHQIEKLHNLIEPLIKEVAESAYYPDSEDVIINL